MKTELLIGITTAALFIVYFLTRARRKEQNKRLVKPGTVVSRQFLSSPLSLSGSPPCLKVETSLRMAKIPFAWNLPRLVLKSGHGLVVMHSLCAGMFGFMPLSFHARAASSLLNLRVFDNVPNYRLLATAAGFESKSLQPKWSCLSGTSIWGTDKENLLNNQDCILVTWMFDSGLMLQGEVKCKSPLAVKGLKRNPVQEFEIYLTSQTPWVVITPSLPFPR